MKPVKHIKITSGKVEVSSMEKPEEPKKKPLGGFVHVFDLPLFEKETKSYNKALEAFNDSFVEVCNHIDSVVEDSKLSIWIRISESERRYINISIKDGFYPAPDDLVFEIKDGLAICTFESKKQHTMKYRKKPVVIEAVQWTGDNLKEVISFTGKHPKWDIWFKSWDEYEAHVKNDRSVFKILTLEGAMEAMPGDYIIRGIKGEHYPCKPDIFEATYESVKD